MAILDLGPTLEVGNDASKRQMTHGKYALLKAADGPVLFRPVFDARGLCARLESNARSVTVLKRVNDSSEVDQGPLYGSGPGSNVLYKAA